jgi:hypothetical protein
MTICLACMHLRSIGKAFSIFYHETNSLSEELLTLGGQIVGDMKKSSISPVFMDYDFKDRTVLHLITYEGFA